MATLLEGEGNRSTASLVITLEKAAKEYDKAFEAGYELKKKDWVQKENERREKDKYLKNAYRKIKGRFSSPISFAIDEEEVDGQMTKKYVTKPEEIDKVIKKKWLPIYGGNIKERGKMRKLFIDKYKTFIYSRETQKAQPIDDEEFHKTITGAKHNQGVLMVGALLTCQ